MQPQHVVYNFEFVSSLLLPSGVTLSFVSSSVEDDSDTKRLSKEEKGRSLGWHRSRGACRALAAAGCLFLVHCSPRFFPRRAFEPFVKPFALLCYSFCSLWVVGSRPGPQGWHIDFKQTLVFAGALWAHRSWLTLLLADSLISVLLVNGEKRSGFRYLGVGWYFRFINTLALY